MKFDNFSYFQNDNSNKSTLQFVIEVKKYPP